jgi:4-hydroxy-tetrahydrodipicolinate reductase
MSLSVLIAGATGWTGAPLVEAVVAADDLDLAGGIARRGGATFSAVDEALAATSADVFVDYTSAAVVRENVDAALSAGLHVVIGSSGLSEQDFTELDAAARAAGLGVIAAGNFSVLAATLLHAATLAAQHVTHWEVIDYGSSGKPDVPSGTARELAERLGQAAPADHDADLIGPPEARGASVSGTRVHSVRLPSFALSTDVILAAAGDRLVIRHEAGSSAEPYVAGTLLAVRRVGEVTGVLRGLDRLLFGEVSTK